MTAMPSLSHSALHRAPEGDELLLGDPERQVQVDRHPARREPRDGGVRGEDVHREPRRALPAVLRHDEDRVAGDRHDIAAADVDDADVHAVLRRHEHRGVAAAEPRVDDFLEDFGEILPISGRSLTLWLSFIAFPPQALP